MAALTGLAVLLVDDDEDTRDLLEMVLDGQGASVRAVCSAADARDAIHARAPDIVLTDIDLPDEDGCTLVAALRADATTRAIPAIALTGHSDGASRRRAVEAGFQRFITKPFDVLSLASEIASVMSEARAPACGRRPPT